MDLKYLSDEYLKLMDFSYSFGIENGEKLDVSFDIKGFYHLLGLKKFKDVTVVRMVEFGVLRKEQFFKEVQNGNITYYQSNVEKTENFVDEKIINFCDAKKTTEVQRVLADRIPFFSYKCIIDLFQSELIILYDSHKGLDSCSVDADKIFFKMIEKDYRNLYLFIKDKAETPLSFFRETKPNLYIKTKQNVKEKEQKKAVIIYKSVWSKTQNLLTEFDVNWEKVRFCYSRNKSANYKAQINLENCFKKGTIVHSTDVKMRLVDNEQKKQKYIFSLSKYELIQKFLIDSESDVALESAITLLEHYEIDIEKDKDKFDYKELQRKINKIKNDISHLNKEKKRLEKFQPMLFQLEKEEIICVYHNYFEKISFANDDFFEQLIYAYRVFDNIYFPAQIKQFYKKQRKLEYN